MATIVDGDFEWDPDKAEANIAKHGVGFEEAVRVFADPFAIDQDDGAGTDRRVVIGMLPNHRLLAVVCTSRGWRERIISARDATRTERALYENG